MSFSITTEKHQAELWRNARIASDLFQRLIKKRTQIENVSANVLGTQQTEIGSKSAQEFTSKQTKKKRQATKKSRQRKDYELKKARKDICPIFAMRVRMREAVRNAIRMVKGCKTMSTSKYLGCSYKDFAAHIESQFTDGMTWDNRSQWHIDHITPLATAKTVEDVIRLNHYTNLRPLWAIDNLRKGAKLDYKL